mmetsp:Transcript_80630/g.250233  ORF Transcript_80630/g.250233 Transcript_80630/m.250233 type:complete len:244 (-) Transcript_80630:807-1538(-)
MQTRSFVATSSRRASCSAKAFWSANCRAAAAVFVASTKRRFCMSALLLKDVSSWRMGAASSGISATSLVRPWICFCTACRANLTVSTAASTVVALVFRSSASSCADSADSASASASAPRIWASRPSISDMSCALSVESISSLSETSARRFSASSRTSRSRSSRAARFARLRSSSRAMPTAVFRTRRSSSSRPLRPLAKSCLQMRSRLAVGSSKPNSSRAYFATSSRLRSPSPSASYLLKILAC